MTATPDLWSSRAALLPIDMQRGFDLPPFGRRNNPDLDANGLRLLVAWRAAGLPLLHIRHDSVESGSVFVPSHPGNALRPGFEPWDNEPVVAKSVNCAFIATDLDLRLRRLGVGTVVMFGLTTDMCVSTTVRVAANLGYRAILVGDASACFDLPDGAGGMITAEDLQRAHLATLAAEFATVTTTNAVMEGLGA
ncbi:nicotinamidase-related amidase [Inquilinus ginsengisoli]|uniref:Nicotinamidase-related amidase n=1 Tax=Inquilinus ginsengisoli TaxID=363840 RepID=A0ABU1JUI3_9PROT|nr:cysteine hydrolase family protein [Inquilinus ginsengisoli]MDR6292278.1 nicotinamidase-related amidase [Inquilinus ginsengisoli]